MARIIQAWSVVCLMYLVSVSVVESYQFNEQIASNEADGRRLKGRINIVKSNELMIASDERILRDATSYCEYGSEDSCLVVVPPERRRRDTKRSYECGGYYTHRWTTRCGWWGWWRCSRRSTKYRHRTCYRMNYSYYYVQRPCPSSYKRCNVGYFWHNECCLGITRIERVLDEVERRIVKRTTTTTPTTTSSTTTPIMTTEDKIDTSMGIADDDSGANATVTEDMIGTSMGNIDNDSGANATVIDDGMDTDAGMIDNDIHNTTTLYNIK